MPLLRTHAGAVAGLVHIDRVLDPRGLELADKLRQSLSQLRQHLIRTADARLSAILRGKQNSKNK